MKFRVVYPLLAVLLVLGLAGPAESVRADVTLPRILGSGMVLQRDLPVPVWGWADPGEEVVVSFAGQSRSVKAGENGKWLIRLEPLKASAEGAILIVEGNNRIALDNILVGEVWICSGQSNMEWRLIQGMRAKEEVEAASHPGIRLFNVPGHTTSPLPREKGPGSWQVCTPKSASGFSAVGYFFGRRLNRELGVPVGLVGSNWGGTRIEPWVNLAGFESVPELSGLAHEVKQYKARTRVGGSSPSAIYNSMVHPLAPFAMRGGIWYQGESNGNEGISYYHKKHALVNGWRKAFQNKDLAFYWVQLANFQRENPKPVGGDGWAKIREAQTKALDIPGSGMAVITDIGAANDIHPRNKQDVGSRLAQWALHQTYERKSLVPAGPLYKGQEVEGDSIRLSFDHVGKGLMVGRKTGLDPTAEVKDGKLAHFAIAGDDKKWFWAEASIDGDTVVVRSADVPRPAAVRYAFSMNPAKANLYNREGLPAGPFRTDNWPRPSENLKWIAISGQRAPNSVPGSGTELVILNKMDIKVKVFWVPYGGGLRFYGELDPGGTRKQNTFSSASWVITDEKDKPLGYFRTTKKRGIAVIPRQ
jgi:sialate O-acetylesterase